MVEDFKEHAAGEFSSIGILQRWVIAGDQEPASRQRVFGTVRELEARFAFTLASTRQVLQITVEGDSPEADYDAQIGEQRDLLVEMRRAVRQFRPLGRVIRRSAADDGTDPAILEFHAVATSHRIWL